MQGYINEDIFRVQLEILRDVFVVVSKQLHDNIGQVLSLVKLNLNTVNLRDGMTLKEKIDQSKALLTSSIQDLRDAVTYLNPDFLLEMGLVGAVQRRLRWLKKTGPIDTSLVVTGDIQVMEPAEELIVFSAVQQLLSHLENNNYADAILVKMEYLPHTLVVTVEYKEQDGKEMHMVTTDDPTFQKMLKQLELISGTLNLVAHSRYWRKAMIVLPK